MTTRPWVYPAVCAILLALILFFGGCATAPSDTSVMRADCEEQLGLRKGGRHDVYIRVGNKLVDAEEYCRWLAQVHSTQLR